MPGVVEVLKALYEVSTVVTDIVLNKEYIRRRWIEEYALSIAFLVFNGIVMAVVGMQLEATESKNRYVRWRPLNALIGGLLGLLQLRVLAETLFTYVASSRSKKETENESDRSSASVRHDHDQQKQQKQEPLQATPTEYTKRLEEGLVFVTFVQAVVRDVPLFIIQANATIHYRKWKLVDLWAVVSTGVTLVNGVSSYVNTKKSKATYIPKPKKTSSKATLFALATTLFLIGQFVFRLGAILLVATTKGRSIIAYSLAVTAIAIFATISLRLATPAQSTGAQTASALLFFPLFTVFTLDAAFIGPRVGDAKRALFSPKLLLLNAWRVVENTVGILLAVTLPRYTDFGKSTDRQIALIGIGCGAFYFASLLVFLVAVRFSPAEDNRASAIRRTTVMPRPEPTQPPSS